MTLKTPPPPGTLRVLGVMSGSSLDGLDLALCEFTPGPGGTSYQVIHATTVPFEPELASRLLSVMNGSALDLVRLDKDLGRTIGMACRGMLSDRTADLIASHGHTIFHQPAEGLTSQIGNGAWIAALTQLPTLCDFRTKDLAMGGQGAPLVPIGEQDLFAEQDAFLNLGGIANIAVHGARVVGYDVGPCNQALNLVAAEAGHDYDAGGAIARSGTVHDALLEDLNALPFYQQTPPRSLGREWFDAHMASLIRDPRIALNDRMRTTVEHIALMIGKELNAHGAQHILTTGGGAHNTFLVERIRAHCRGELQVPDRVVVDFKEAIIFAYLGLLRWRGLPNALASVTGARRDSIGGALYLPN